MASATVDVGIGLILSLLENETLLLSGVHSEIEKMKKELLIIKSFLEDNHKHVGNGSTTSATPTQVFQTFVANSRDLAYQVEDIIDEFNYHIHGYRRCTKLWRAFHFPRYIWARHSIAQKLRMVNVMIQSLSESMKRYHHPEIPPGPPLSPVDDGGAKWLNNISEASLFFSENSLVGIDAAKGKLIGWLLSPEPQRIVVPVVGMGGSGKTTLSANIFKSESIRKHFGSYAWATISKSYVIEDVFRIMIKEFYKEAETQIPGDLYCLSYRELVEKLVEYLQSKRYFVVLDDVWNTSLWKQISIALPDGISGSRVMITTRSNSVASFPYGIGSRHHEIELLKEDEAWVLFCNKAFSGSLEECRRRNLEQIARKLVERCQGLPLAIASLGTMMSTKKLESEWKQVYNSLNWELSHNLELKVVRSILLLSFSDLPYPLKRCFLYCSLFPMNYRMKRKRLVRMWMAQRFVEPIRGVKAEEVADSYLNELVYRNMLQVILWNPFGRPKVFKMHDVIREIALSISKNERFCDVSSNDNDGDDDDANTAEDHGTRHLCIQKEMRSGTVRRTNLHSLLVCTNKSIELPPCLKLLRALDLEGSGISRLPDILVTLFNLKYLNLSKTEVMELPRDFHRLINLETLKTRHSKIEELPPGMYKLRKLRHLITYRSNYGHDSNWNYVLGTRASPNISQLKDLQVMDCFNAEAELIKKLGIMTQLTRISLVMIRREHGSDLCESLNKIRRLRFLSLTSIHEEEPLEIDGLTATASIEKLFLAGKLERVPSWFSTLQNLTYLGLRGSQMQENVIHCIQALPKLVWLSFYNAYMGTRLCFAEGFQNLKILDMVQMQHLTEVVIEDGAMFELQKLYVKACRALESVPKGIENLVNLQELHLSHVSDQLVERIRGEEGVDRSRVNHIPDIKHHFRTDNGSFYVSLSS